MYKKKITLSPNLVDVFSSFLDCCITRPLFLFFETSDLENPTSLGQYEISYYVHIDVHLVRSTLCGGVVRGLRYILGVSIFPIKYYEQRNLARSNESRRSPSPPPLSVLYMHTCTHHVEKVDTLAAVPLYLSLLRRPSSYVRVYVSVLRLFPRTIGT